MFWAFLGALLIGISLGLLGSGGSILTVPVLIYLVGEPEKVAIAESLGIVTAISLLMLPYAIRKLVHWKSVVYFGIPGMLERMVEPHYQHIFQETPNLSFLHW